MIYCIAHKKATQRAVFSFQVLLNKNIIMSSFKSSGDIQEKEGGPDSCFG